MNRFRKAERLCSKKQIEMLFTQGRVVFIFPFRIFYRLTAAEPASHAAPCRIMITVPKRNFKKAVHRNLLKRRVREAFRRHKQELNAALTVRGKWLQMVLYYACETALPYESLAETIKKIKNELMQRAES